MWPSIFEFHWDTGHMIFFGVFYAVVIAIATALVYVFTKSIVDSFNDDEGAGTPPGKCGRCQNDFFVELTPIDR